MLDLPKCPCELLGIIPSFSVRLGILKEIRQYRSGDPARKVKSNQWCVFRVAGPRPFCDTEFTSQVHCYAAWARWCRPRAGRCAWSWREMSAAPVSRLCGFREGMDADDFFVAWLGWWTWADEHREEGCCADIYVLLTMGGLFNPFQTPWCCWECDNFKENISLFPLQD